MDDRIFATVNDLIAHLDEPCHKSGRAFPNPIIREILRSLGVQTCPDCHRFTGMAQRTERPLRRKGTGWREAINSCVTCGHPSYAHDATTFDHCMTEGCECLGWREG